MSLTLRPPDLDDGPAVARLVRRCPPLDVNSDYLYLLLCHDFAATCAVAEAGTEGAGRELVGFVTGYRPPSRPDALFVWQVAVSEAARGQKLAGRMIQSVLARESSDGIRFIEATVSPSNTASQRLFAGLARSLGGELQVSGLFPASLFGPSEAGGAGHEQEDLYRIGPFARPSVP